MKKNSPYAHLFVGIACHITAFAIALVLVTSTIIVPTWLLFLPILCAAYLFMNAMAQYHFFYTNDSDTRTRQSTNSCTKNLPTAKSNFNNIASIPLASPVTTPVSNPDSIPMAYPITQPRVQKIVHSTKGLTTPHPPTI